MPPKLLDLEKLLRTPAIDSENGFDISPNGEKVAFSWNKTGQWEIYIVEIDNPDNLRIITGGEGAKFAPCFSPDGNALLFLVDTNGSEQFDIFFYDLISDIQINLTPNSDDTIIPHLDWSPNGQWITFISDRSGHFSTYLQEIDRNLGRLVGDPKLVFDGSGPNMGVEWSPDGGRLVIAAESTAQDYATIILSLDDQKETQQPLSLAINGATLNASQGRWSANGRMLAFSSDFPGNYTIGIFYTKTGDIDWLAARDGDESEPRWSKDGCKICCVNSIGPESWLKIHDLVTGNSQQFQIEPGLHSAPVFTPDGEKIILAFESPRRPNDLWVFNLESQKFQQLTHSLPLDFSPEDFIMPEHIYYTSRDGQKVPALLFNPSPVEAGKTIKAPGVIIVHGGPTWLFSYLWYPIMAHMASRGWVVLAPNYRGSTGYGRTWQLANRFELGKADTMDVAAGVDYLIDAGLVDPQRIAITGRSHGGYLTMSCMTVYPELWAAGSAVVPFLNWFTSHENSRKDLQHWDIENMGDPISHQALWRERSPFFHLDRIVAPVQLICGANDPRCPASESTAAYKELIRLGKEVDYLLYSDEGHSFLKVENVVDHEIKRIDFLRKNLEKQTESRS